MTGRSCPGERQTATQTGSKALVHDRLPTRHNMPRGPKCPPQQAPRMAGEALTKPGSKGGHKINETPTLCVCAVR
eukprot:2356450-Pyramimonas_sp.AAC.1